MDRNILLHPTQLLGTFYPILCIIRHLHVRMERTVLTLAALAFIFSFSGLLIVLVYCCFCRDKLTWSRCQKLREREWNPKIDGEGFAVKYDNTHSSKSVGIASEEIIKHECQLDNLSDHVYEEIPSTTVSLHDMYIDDMIQDQKKYLDNVSDNVHISERIYHTLKQEDITPCQMPATTYTIEPLETYH